MGCLSSTPCSLCSESRRCGRELINHCASPATAALPAASAELGVPLTLERFIRWTSRLDSCTRAQRAAARIRVRARGYAARGRERYTEFARRATEPFVATLGLPDMQQACDVTPCVTPF